jgi:hypothetical protein
MGHAIPLDSSSATSIGMVLGHTGVLDGLHPAAAWVAGSAVKRGADIVAGGPFRKGTMLNSAQHRNENMSTKTPNQLRSLLQDYGVYPPMGAVKLQLLKIINSIPQESHSLKRKPIVTTHQLTWVLTLFGVSAIWIILFDWGFTDNTYILEIFSYLGTFLSHCSVVSSIFLVP